MMLEVLILAVCAQGAGGCGQSTSAYYEQSEALQAFSRRIENSGKEMVRGNEWIVYAAHPAYAVATRRPAHILIRRGTTLSVDVWTQSVGVEWAF